MLKGRILVVDDEAAIHRFLKPALDANGFSVIAAYNGSDAIRLVAADAPDAVILDLGLADMDGKEVIGKVRAFSQVPLIVLSARDREAEKIAALDLGADDYINKPFGVGELMARLRTALRHREGRTAVSDVVSIGDLTVDVPRHRATKGGKDLRLTPKEFDLLALLARNAGRVLTHQQILTAVWGPAHADDTQYLRVYVGQLRHKLGDDAGEPRVLLTEPGIGYRLRED